MSPKCIIIFILFFISHFFIYALSYSDIAAWWKFNEGTGTTAYDSINSRSAILTGTTWTSSGISGNALNFSGYSKGVIQSFYEPDNMSLSIWFKTTDNHQYATFYSTSAFHSDYNGIWVGMTHGYITCSIAESSVSGWMSIQSSQTYNNNQWHHLMFTWNGTTNANSAKVYVDGALIGQSQPLAIPTGRTFAPHIGCDPYFTDSRFGFTGTLDELVIYNRALDSTEVLSVYQSVPEISSFLLLAIGSFGILYLKIGVTQTFLLFDNQGFWKKNLT